MQFVFWVVLSALILLGLQTLVFGKTSLKKVAYRRYFTKTRLFEGEEMEMVEIISNRKLLPVPWVLVESRVPRELRIIGARQQLDVEGELYHRSSFTLAPFQQITRRHRVKCTHRGYYSATSAVLTGGDLFGLVSNTVSVELASFAIVYPAQIPVEDIPLPSLKWQGDLVVKRYIMPDMFLYGGIRDYLMGDAIKNIHWGASAATGVLKVKQHDYTASPRLLITLNVQPSESVWGEIPQKDMPDIEEGIRLACSLALYLLDNGIEVGFATNGRYMENEDTVYIEPSCSFEQRELLLDCFARMRVFRQRSFHQFLASLPPFKEIDMLIVTCYRSELMDEACADIRARGNSLGFHLLRPEV